MGIWLTLRLPPDPPRVPVDHGACIAHQSADHYAVAGCRARVATWGLGTCNPMTLVPSAKVPAERRVGGPCALCDVGESWRGYCVFRA